MIIRPIPILAAALVGAVSFAAPAAAQTSGVPAPQAAPSENIEGRTLDKFAAAATQIQELKEKWTSRVASATDEAESAELQKQAFGEMTAAVENQGITVAEYNEIARAAEADPQLRQRIAQRLQ